MSTTTTTHESAAPALLQNAPEIKLDSTATKSKTTSPRLLPSKPRTPKAGKPGKSKLQPWICPITTVTDEAICTKLAMACDLFLPLGAVVKVTFGGRLNSVDFFPAIGGDIIMIKSRRFIADKLVRIANGESVQGVRQSFDVEKDDY
jgi:hypothetical protein